MFVSDVVCDEVGFCDDVCYQAGDEYPLPERDCFCVRVFEAGGELSSENCGAVFSKPSKDEGGEGFDGDFSGYPLMRSAVFSQISAQSNSALISIRSGVPPASCIASARCGMVSFVLKSGIVFSSA